MLIREIREDEKYVNALRFAESYQARETQSRLNSENYNRQRENQYKQIFWLELLHRVFGVEEPGNAVEFEKPVQIEGTTKFIDCYIAETKVLIEHKSGNRPLNADALEQAYRYGRYLPAEEIPEWIVLCNFREFKIYKLNDREPRASFALGELPTKYPLLNFLINPEMREVPTDADLTAPAGKIVADLYQEFLSGSLNPEDPEILEQINILIVRIVFLLYADSTGILGDRLMFHNYLKDSRGYERLALKRLFHVLDMNGQQRDAFDPYIRTDETIRDFPYINGGLFRDTLDIPNLTDTAIRIILNAGLDYNWGSLSPTIFGSMFESTLNPKTRHLHGMHYTSLENIHKVIDNLFLNDLKKELRRIIERGNEGGWKTKWLRAFHRKLANLYFLDPACGSGNFLTETYMEIRRLENTVIEELSNMHEHGQIVLGFDGDPEAAEDRRILVNINQFYGIEINGFAVSVARAALWIAESQMYEQTKRMVYLKEKFFPLTSNAGIRQANAVTADWKELTDNKPINYIMGNPPFLGARNPEFSADMKQELFDLFDGFKNPGNLDYASCWFKKASDFMTGTQIKTALVCTNSICQGQQVSLLWTPLFSQGIHIDFAYRTFRWKNDAAEQAKVHCVIVGFSKGPEPETKVLYMESGERKEVPQINGYLENKSVWHSVESRKTPLWDVPIVKMGNQPIDNGNYLFTKEEKEEFIRKEPESERFFREWYGAEEFLGKKPRFCLWLGDATPEELERLPECRRRIRAVREYRANSQRKATQKLAMYPRRFQTENIPTGSYLVIPEVSGEVRDYIPIGFMDSSVLCSNKVRLIPEAGLYHFGVLMSSVHMGWVRTVCGRLEKRYDYSIQIVYNNFPWPEVTEEQKARIEETARGILAARDRYPGSSYKALYGDGMPEDLMRAHIRNDRAVKTLYGLDPNASEDECNDLLFRMYQEKVSLENNE